MREIKLRAWHTVEKKMYHYVEHTTYRDGSTGVTLLMDTDGYSFAPNDTDVELMEYIERLDLDDKEMCEGDIIEYLDNTSQGLVKKIVAITDIRHLPDFTCSKWEKIIGNIYENPELADGN